MEKAKRTQWVTFLDTKPKTASHVWALLGQGVTAYAIAYNPQITTEKYIINENASSSHDSNQKQGDVSQKIYAGDPCYEYMNSLIDKTGADVEGNVLDIDKLHGIEEGGVMKYPAKLSKCITPVTSHLGEEAVIEYSIYYNADAVEGTAVITDGVPTFTPNAVD
jgi:hypothetical protein